MKELSIDRMAAINGGNCAVAVGFGVVVGVGMIASAIYAPAIWASPKTWFGAASLVSNTALAIDYACK